MDVDEEGVRTSAGRARVGSVRRHAHLINGPESSVLKEISRRLALNSRTLAEVPIETSVLVPSDKMCQPKVLTVIKEAKVGVRSSSCRARFP